ncbi:KpsF/GutQ family sugar-phosphate isomerase [candidate division KSB1 bacterium]|nr:KpsF/GutQ family sugar-phosphate isomerase [candidate division KSB1 bacterium]
MPVELSKIEVEDLDHLEFADKTEIIERGKRVIRIEAAALRVLENRIDDNFYEAVKIIHNATGRVVITGIGKSGIVGKKIAATFTSLGKAAYFLHPTEGVHGDLGMVMKNDVTICISKSGNSDEITQILPIFRRIGVPIISITGNSQSELALRSDVVLDVSVDEEACPFDMAPTASTTATLAMGDALAISLIELRNFSLEDFALLHPGGTIGRKLTLRIDDLMFTGNRVAKVLEDTTLHDVLFEITSKRFGATAVIGEDNQLVGIITDGDLRRLLEKQLNFYKYRARDILSPNPIVAKTGMMATDVMNIVKINAINQIIVINEEKQPIGMIHLHDLLRAGLS